MPAHRRRQQEDGAADFAYRISKKMLWRAVRPKYGTTRPRAKRKIGATATKNPAARASVLLERARSGSRGSEEGQREKPVSAAAAIHAER